MNTVARQYINTAKKYLICPSDYREKYLKLLEKDVEACLEENPDASLSDLEKLLGSPQSAAESYLEEVPPEILSAYAQKRKRNKWVGIVVIITSILLLIALVIYIGHIHAGFSEVIYSPQDASVSNSSSRAT